MRFVQVGDIHFDVPFRAISDRAGLGEMRRLEQRKAFKKVIDFVNDKKVDFLFICGDLYEQDYVRKSTIDFINNEFEKIKNTRVILIPGNHDPFIKNSYYNNYSWNENVIIVDKNIRKIECDDVDIYAYGFDDFELENEEIYKLNLNKEKFNILLTHGDLYSASKYNSINLKRVLQLGFDYIAIGHIHKRDEYYSGSLISLGFDELGEHGFIYGKVENKKLNREFIKADDREFIVEDLDVSNIESEDELIEILNEIDTKDDLYEINLIGKRKASLDINIKLVQENIIKIKDSTEFEVNFENKRNEKTLTGFFIKNLKEKLENGEITEEQYKKVLEVGYKILIK